MQLLQGVLGLAVIMGIAWLWSERRQDVHWLRVGVGLVLQFALTLLMFHAEGAQSVFNVLNSAVTAISAASTAGSAFVFGYLSGEGLPFAVRPEGSAFILAFGVLPIIIVMSALSALLFYWKILPALVHGLSYCLRKSMNVGGALAIGVAANVFMGMIESPMLIRPYLARMSRSELFALMVTGMSTLAGTVLVLYATILSGILENPLLHILTASLISCPAALLLSELFIPAGSVRTANDAVLECPYKSSLDAVCTGTMDGLQMYLNILAMLIVFVAFVALGNSCLTLLPQVDGANLTFQRILGWIFAPLAWLMGIPWEECLTAGSLLGTKTVLNELIAYADMAALPVGTLSTRSILIMTYALCGFANLGSLGIMLGGMCFMVPERKDEIRQLGMRAVIAGTLATCMTGAIVGVITV